MPAPRDRLFLAAIAMLNAVTGAVVAATLAPISFGGDVDIFRRGAQGLLTGEAVTDFLYPPLTAALAIPLTWIPFEVAALGMSILGGAILVSGCLFVTRGWRPLDRLLVAVAVFGFLGVVNELILGQVTTIIAAAIFLVVTGEDRRRNGIALGLVLATLPKPFLVPVLLWALVYRRRAALTSIATGSVVGLAGLLVFGLPAHRRWIESLTIAGSTTRDMTASAWVDGVTPVALVVTIAAVVAFVAAMRRPEMGAVAAVAVGLILAPYTLAYGTTALLAVAPVAFRVAPVTARAGSLAANIALLVAFGGWAVAILLGTVIEGSRRLVSGPSRPIAPTSERRDGRGQPA